jgi:hypothetical protein
MEPEQRAGGDREVKGEVSDAEKTGETGSACAKSCTFASTKRCSDRSTATSRRA